jgi:hypothetical protein
MSDVELPDPGVHPEQDDDSDDSDDEFAEVEISDRDTLVIMNLEAELEKNPNLYDVHVQVTRWT